MKGLTRDELAALCGVPKSTIKQYETDPGARIELINVLVLARTFGVSIELLMTDPDILPGGTLYRSLPPPDTD